MTLYQYLHNIYNYITSYNYIFFNFKISKKFKLYNEINIRIGILKYTIRRLMTIKLIYLI